MTFYRLLVQGRLGQTAALFIGIPALLAVLVVFAARPVSLVGTIFKAITTSRSSSSPSPRFSG
jgi:hypothetical protein